MALTQIIAQAMGQARMPQLAQRFLFELPDALPTQAKEVRDLFKGVRFVPAEAKPQPQDVALAFGEFAEHFFDRFLQDALDGHLDRAGGIAILDEIAKFAVIFVADRLIQGGGVTAGTTDFARHLHG